MSLDDTNIGVSSKLCKCFLNIILILLQNTNDLVETGYCVFSNIKNNLLG
jgi:hypothetical protein